MTAAPLDLSGLVQLVTDAHAARAAATGAAGVGAIASFLGTVRNVNRGRAVVSLDYEAYDALALKVFEQIADEVAREWPDAILGLHHRTGRLAVGEASVAIAAASPHRGAAFAACRYAIERVKQVAPIWKREQLADGECWVEGATVDPADERARQEALRLACV